MRIRSIKPQFFRDSKILDLPPLARLLYIGLWCCADREGRMEFDARELRTQVLPEETPKTVSSLFVLLATAGLTHQYTVDGREYLVIPNFLKHQIPHHREQPSTSPGPAQGEAIPKQVEGRSVSSSLSGEPSEGTVDTVRPRRSNAARSAPASPVHPSPLLNGEGRKIHEENFVTLYQFYPRHVGREAAWKAFLRLSPDGDMLKEIARDVKRRTDGGEWCPDDPERVRFIPHLATYLNQRRWADER